MAAVARQVNEAETVGYIALAAAFFAYWCAKENCPAAIKEFVKMGIAAYFRQIKEEVIAEAKAESKAEGISEGEARGRELAISELRAMPRHEALALLEREESDAESEPESPYSANGQPPPA